MHYTKIVELRKKFSETLLDVYDLIILECIRKNSCLILRETERSLWHDEEKELKDFGFYVQWSENSKAYIIS